MPSPCYFHAALTAPPSASSPAMLYSDAEIAHGTQAVVEARGAGPAPQAEGGREEPPGRRKGPFAAPAFSRHVPISQRHVPSSFFSDARPGRVAVNRRPSPRPVLMGLDDYAGRTCSRQPPAAACGGIHRIVRWKVRKRIYFFPRHSSCIRQEFFSLALLAWTFGLRYCDT